MIFAIFSFILGVVDAILNWLGGDSDNPKPPGGGGRSLNFAYRLAPVSSSL